jgi:hypothetical protein
MTTDIIHRSKIGLEILIPIVLVIGTVTTIMVINLVWVGLVVCGLVILFVTNIYTGTYYKITTNNHLFIKCGFIETFDIEIKDIEWIKTTKELISSPALSIDRLEINYKGGRVLISPKDKKKFMDDLRKINPKLWWTK